MSIGKNITAQSTIEFTFAMVAIMFLIYGMVMLFRWAGMDLANRRFSQDTMITTTAFGPYTDQYPGPGDPAAQLNSDIGSSTLPLDAVYHGEVANGNTSQ